MHKIDFNEISTIYRGFQRELNLYSAMYEETNVSKYIESNMQDSKINMYSIVRAKVDMHSKGYEILIPNNFKNADVYRQIEINWENGLSDIEAIQSKNPFVRTLINTQLSALGDYIDRNRSQREFIVISFASLLETVSARLVSLSLGSDNENKFVSNLQMDYKTLSSFDSVEDAREYLVSKKTSDLMFKPFKVWSREILKILAPRLWGDQKMKATIDILNEMYARRNIYIHNKGKVNKLYLGLVEDNAKFKDEKIGLYLPTDLKYLDEVENSAWQFITDLILELIDKDASDFKQINKFLTEIGLNLYKRKKFELGTYFFKKATKFIREKYDEDSFEVYMMNYNEMLGYKLSNNYGKQTKIDKFINFFRNKVSWWADTPEEYTEFALKSLILEKDEFLNESIAFIGKKMKSDKVTVGNMVTWPMFQLLDSDDEWNQFVDKVYDWGVHS